MNEYLDFAIKMTALIILGITLSIVTFISITVIFQSLGLIR